MRSITKHFTRFFIVIAAVALTLSSPGTAQALDELFSIGNGIYYYDPDDTCSPTSVSSETSTTGAEAQIEVTLGQANIVTPSRHPTPQRNRVIDSINKFSSYKPDFFTFNEIAPNTDTNYQNYKSFKKNHPGAKSTEDTGVRILWDSDKWKKIDGGIEQIHPFEELGGPKKDRYALWAVFQNINNGGIISVIATHYNTRATFPPNLGRAKTQSENLKATVDSLLPKGPVLIGGDFNFQLYDAAKPYSPASILGQSGLKPAFKKGEGTFVDWIFYSNQLKLQDKKVYATDESVSDHPYLVAKFEGSTSAGVVDSSGCICEVSNLSSTILVGSKNDEKVFNYFRSKGLSDIQTAGIMGNMAIESGFDPENVQNDTSDAQKYGERTKDPKPLTAGWGLIQWTPGSKVVQAAIDAGVGDQPIHELATQLDIVWGHLNNKPPITKGSFSIPEYKNITDVEKAVNYFEDKIEGAGEPNYLDRYTAARLALEQFSGKASTSPPGSTGGSPVGDCESLDSGAAAGNAVQTALNYAWPEYHKPNYTKLKPAYAKAVSAAQKNGKYVGGEQYPGVDCGGFVTRVMQDSGVDPEYGGGGNTTTQERHLAESGKYEKINNPTSANLPPGAIAISSSYGGDGTGHTYMYVGKQAGFETQIASASYSGQSNSAWRAPMAGHELVADPNYNWYVLK